MHWDQMSATPDDLRERVTRGRRSAGQLGVLASIIDGRLERAASVFVACGVATLFGLIHSPLANGAVFWPWSAGRGGPLALASAYGAGAGILLLLGRLRAGGASGGARPASRRCS